mgnify:FL=1
MDLPALMHKRESKLLQAELYIAAEDFPAARRALGDLPEDAPDARVLTIMAAIERGEGASDAVVEGWLTRALAAPRGPQWVCDKCHNIHREWVPVCENCDSFDTLSWTTPPAPGVVSPTGTEMLPLIVSPQRGDERDENTAEAEVSEAELVPPAAEETQWDRDEK